MRDEGNKINEILMNAYQTAEVNNFNNANAAVYHSDSYFDN